MHTNLKIEELAASITRSASLQTYTTVRLLVDRDRVVDAYQAYAYFRWVDDWLDGAGRQRSDRLAFARRQETLIEDCYAGRAVAIEAPEESMLVALIARDSEKDSGLQSYIRNMMAVMAFDAERRGRLITQDELNQYQHALSAAVTEALHYFIGHDAPSPQGSNRYLAAEGAHIVHMLRDTLEDNELGYFNIPREYIKAHGISVEDTASEAYRSWVRGRVELARSCFRSGRLHLAEVRSFRCRIAGYAYMARFEMVLDFIERDAYRLRPQYRESKGPMAGAQMGWSVLWSAFAGRRPNSQPGGLTIR